MNEQEPAHLLRHVLLCMPHGIWYALDAAADFAPTVLQSSGLTAFQLETLLYSTAILQKRGEETHFVLTSLLCPIGVSVRPPQFLNCRAIAHVTLFEDLRENPLDVVFRQTDGYNGSNLMIFTNKCV